MEQRNRGKGSAKRSKYGKKKNRVTKPDARADWTRTGKEEKKEDRRRRNKKNKRRRRSTTAIKNKREIELSDE